MDQGARPALPGEFTFRAFLHGKLDLVQAEAVADLIEAVTPAQARAACDQLEGTLTRAIGEVEHELFSVRTRLEASLDFPEDGYHFIDRSSLRTSLERCAAQVERLLASAFSRPHASRRSACSDRGAAQRWQVELVQRAARR